MLGFFVRRLPFRARATIVRHTVYTLLAGPLAAMLGLASFVAIKALDASDWEVAILSATFPLGNLLAVFWAARISNRSKTPFVLWPQVFTMVILLTMPWVRSAAVFTVVVCLTMLAQSPVVSALTAITRLNYPPHRRSSLVAIARSGSVITASVYAFFAGGILDMNPNYFRVLFPAAALGVLAGAVQFFRVRVSGELRLRERSESSPMTFGGVIGILFRDRSFRRYEYSFFAFGFANIMLLPVFPLFLEQEFDAGYLDAGLALVTIPTLLSLLFLPVWGRILDRRNPLLVRFIVNLAFMVFPLSCYFAQGMGLVYFGKGVQGIFTGGSALVWLLGVNYFAAKTEVPAYMALHQTLTGIRGLIAPFTGIWLMNALGMRPTFLVCAGLMLFGALLMFREVIHEWGANGLRTYTQAELESDRSAVS
jgi:MFS family permease